MSVRRPSTPCCETPWWSRVLLFGILGLLSGCATWGTVQPWEKGVLAKPEMTFDLDRLDSAFVEHTYFSKEGTWGGATVSGGGCGCN
jgi:hypothetical protein